MNIKSVAVVFPRLGPYHVARLNAAGDALSARGISLLAIETAMIDTTYGWDRIEGGGHFERLTLFAEESGEQISEPRIRRAVVELLDRRQPDAVALPGWHFPEALAGLRWCRRNGKAAILMSESARHDFPRVWWKEWWKRRTVREFDAALVGGRLHADYAEALGVPADRIFPGYDVVDNDYFQQGSDRAREQVAAVRARHGLPERYFLASSRFIEKKNLPRLLDAYAGYTRREADPADLVLCGDGPLRETLVSQVQSLGLAARVHLPGFLQYDVLPDYYALAIAFVLPSTTEQWGLVVNEAMAAALPVLVSERCGCAAELVEDGVNGFRFDPFDAGQLSALLSRLTSGECDVAGMGRAARQRIGEWSPKRFADGLWRAVACSVGITNA